jgi:hypothetical protein
MEVIFHLGFPKTGSTSLQASLGESVNELSSEGVWYPVVEKRFPSRHNLLAAPFRPMLQRSYSGKVIEGNSPQDHADIAWKEIARRAPEFQKVIISSEQLGMIPDVEAFGRFFRNNFAGVQARAILYLRRPSDHFVSNLQQRIKGTHSIDGVSPTDFHFVAKEWSKVFPVELRELTPSKLVGKTISSDFSEFAKLKSKLPELRKNESLSAEGMQILQDYRTKYHSNTPNRFTDDTKALERAIRRVEKKDTKKVLLKPSVAEAVNSLGFIDRLRDDFGFEFERVDYSDRARPKDRLEHFATEGEIRNYIVVDEKRLIDIHVRLLGDRLRTGKHTTP